ncbi:hypothetical protein NKG94_21425 [Micromonospora sp. M12]
MADMGAWAALLPNLTDVDRRRVEVGLPEADARVRALLHTASRYHWRHSVTHVPEWSAVETWPVEVRRSAALAMHREAATSSTPTALNDVVRSSADGDLPWTREDLVWCLQVCARGESYDNGAHLELPAVLAARLAPAGLADLVPALDAFVSELVGDPFVAAEPRRRAVLLIGEGLGRATGRRVPPWLLHTGDGFGPLARAELAPSSPRRACRSCWRTAPHWRSRQRPRHGSADSTTSSPPHPAAARPCIRSSTPSPPTVSPCTTTPTVSSAAWSGRCPDSRTSRRRTCWRGSPQRRQRRRERRPAFPMPRRRRWRPSNCSRCGPVRRRCARWRGWRSRFGTRRCRAGSRPHWPTSARCADGRSARCWNSLSTTTGSVPTGDCARRSGRTRQRSR